MTRALIYIAALFPFIDMQAQTFAGTFCGFWADTNWKFEFSNDSVYKRTSSGHYGQTIVTGKYKINGDTLIMISGYQNTNGTVNNKYLIDGDSCIIDIKLKYDYCKTRPIKLVKEGRVLEQWISSKKRNIMYPQLPTENKEKIKEVEMVLQQLIDWAELQKFYHTDTDTTRNPLVISNYYEVRANNGINLTKFGQPVVFKSENEIKNEGIKAFIEIEEFNITSSDRITVVMRYKIEGVHARIYFCKNSTDNVWTIETKQSKLFEF